MEAVETTKNISRGFVIPKRFIIAFLTFLVLTRSFMSRNTLQIAASLLIQQNAKKVTSNWTSICRSSQSASKSHEPYKDIRRVNYDWSPKTIASLEMYFSSSSAVANLCGGFFADVFGAKHVISIGVLGESVITLIIPFLVYITNRNIKVVIIERVIHGFFMGLLIPAINSIISHWIPPQERARVCALVYTGLMVGHAAEHAATESMIIAHHDWAVPFYVYGCTGMVLLFIWWLYASSDPDSCLIIDSAENLYIEKAFEGTVDHRRKKIPLRRILLSPPVWAVILGSCSHIWGWYFGFIFVKLYKNFVFGVNTHNSFSQALPWIGMMLSSVLCGIFCDLVINKKVVNRIAIRKTIVNIGNMGGPIYILAALYAGCHLRLANILHSVAMVSMGLVAVGMKLIIMDMTPNYTGFITGLSLFISVVMTRALPSFIAALAPNRIMLQFKNLFWASFGICFATNFVFVIFGESDLQEWNTPFRFN